jgi:hypothetical protein
MPFYIRDYGILSLVSTGGSGINSPGIPRMNAPPPQPFQPSLRLLVSPIMDSRYQYSSQEYREILKIKILSLPSNIQKPQLHFKWTIFCFKE